MSLRVVTRARDQSLQSKSVFSAKFLQNLQPKQHEKAQLNYKSTLRNSLPNIVHLSRNLTELDWATQA